MPPARNPAHASRRPSRAARAPRQRPRVLAGGAAAIRWDRVSRVALLIVLLVLVYLYAGPARSYWDTVRQAEQRRAEVATLKRENARLRARRDSLRSASALEREARRLGMVKPGERPYVVSNLPKGR
jgi:cell division protein FtsB